MKGKSLWLAAAMVIISVSFARAEEVGKFFFYSILPKDYPSCFLQYPGMEVRAMRIRQIDVEIPGLPTVEGMDFAYTEYAGKLLVNWQGTTMLWRKGKGYWPLLIHIAVPEGAGKEVIWQQAYYIGFLKALFLAGFDLSRIKDDREGIVFLFDGKSWRFIQLEEAVGIWGAIRGALAEGRPELIAQIFSEALKRPECSEEHELTKALIEKAQSDPERYGSELEKLMGEFLKQAPKIGAEKQTPKSFKHNEEGMA